MPTPYQYTNRRRILMQVVLIAILAATVGLAALSAIGASRRRRFRWPPISLGLYSIAIPEGWKVTRDWLKDMPPTPRVEALDPNGGRRLEVVQHFLDYATTPESYLETFRKTEGLEPRPITIAGQPGVAVEGRAVREGNGWTNVTWHQYAVTVTTENLVLLLHLESPGRNLTAGDRKLFRDLIAKVALRPAEQPG